MYTLKIIIASTRPGRKGPAMADWIFDLAKKEGTFTVEMIDLKTLDLPFMDEPNHPRLRQYTKDHTLAWGKQVEEADAFIIVTPEYNYSYPATIKNAIDYLHSEWSHKPVAFVSYGGVAAGTRAVQALKLVVTALKMVAINESINIPFFTKHIDGQGKFNADDGLNAAAHAMLKELLKWTGAMAPMRKP